MDKFTLEETRYNTDVNIVNKLKEDLDNSYEIYYKPNLNGDRPHILIMKKRIGIYIIKISDWDLSKYSYEKKENDTKKYFYEKNTHKRFRSPFDQVNSCKNNLFEFYSKKLMERKIFNKKYYGVVSCGVYFQHFKESEFKHHIPLSKFMKFNKYINVWGYDSNIVKDIKRWGEDKKYNLFDTEIYDEIFNFINPAIHLEGDGACISFDKKQKSLIESLENKKVKIKGVAGSGKSLVLA